MTTRARALPWIFTLITLLGVAMAGSCQTSDITFSGLFDTTITTTQTAPVTLTSMGIDLILGIGDATAQMSAQLSDSNFDALTISAAGPLANSTLNSSFRFNPSTVEFLSWQTSASFTVLDLAFSSLTSIVKPQTSSYTQLSVSGIAEDISFRAAIKLGTCPFEFWEASACGSWVWLACPSNMNVCLFVDGVVGFRNITASMTDCVLFEDVWGIRGSVDISITYSLLEKTVAPTLHLQPSWFCEEIDVLAEFDGSSSMSVDSLSIYGIRGQFAVDDVTFAFADSFSEEKNSSVTGKADFFERFTLEGSVPSCCGAAPGGFEINTYFGRPPAVSDALLGLGLVTASLDMRVFENFLFVFSAEYPTTSSDWLLTWTFRVLW